MLKKHTLITGSIILSALIGLTGCGHTQFDRGMSGAAIGSATGATVGVLTGMTIGQGVLLGAAGGAIVGLATNSGQINLGKPFWRKDASRSLYKPASQQYSTVTQVQSSLAAKGYNPGPTDGMAGKRTRSAIRAYQKDHGLLVDGQASNQLVSHIKNN